MSAEKAKMSIAHIAADRQYSHFDLYSTNGAGKWEIDFVNLTAFFTERGYYVHKVGSKFEPIRIIDNIVRTVDTKDLKDEIINFIIDSKESRHMHQFFLKNIGKATSYEFIETLPSKKIEFRKDRPNAMQIYYQNCIVKITGDKITTHKYTDLDGYIWESQILPRAYKSPDPNTESDFKKFVFNISNQDPERYKSVCSILGFLLHNYKNPDYCPAIILNDEVISSNPEGGTGKGILIKAVEQFLTTVTIEGKTFNFDKNFVYQAVNADTKLLSFQDVNKTFDFERLFSVLTDGINVEKKGLQSVHYNFSDTPKVVITTNYAIRGAGNSHFRRRHELEISQHYNGKWRPFDEFKKMFFTGWNESEFNQFDAFMIECCQFYLRNGLIHQELINLPEKRLISETNSDFLEFLEDRPYNLIGEIGKSQFYEMFMAEYPAYLKSQWMTKNLFTKWLVTYCEFKGIKIDVNARDRTGKTRVYKFG